jgi:hypothetical protein
VAAVVVQGTTEVVVALVAIEHPLELAVVEQVLNPLWLWLLELLTQLLLAQEVLVVLGQALQEALVGTQF